MLSTISVLQQVLQSNMFAIAESLYHEKKLKHKQASIMSLWGHLVGNHLLMRLIIIGESLAFVRASVNVFCLMLRFT